MMPPDRLDIARRLFDAIARKDLAALLELTDADVEWESFFALGEEGGKYRGHPGIRRYVDDLNDAWDVISPQIEDSLEAGDVIVMIGRVTFRGKLGAGADEQAGWVLKFRAGKVLRFRAFSEPERVLEELGPAGSGS
jgi:ketosteroid isomerase-like protein